MTVCRLQNVNDTVRMLTGLDMKNELEMNKQHTSNCALAENEIMPSTV